MKIGMFDSGVGGLTVLNEFVSKYPNNEYIYYGDNAHMPYGRKSHETLYEYATTIIDFLIEKGAEVIVIACGTVSSTILEKLRNYSSVEIYDIISPTIKYVNTLEKRGVLATSSTINTLVFGNIMSIDGTTLVKMIEANEDVSNCIDDYVKYFSDCDYLILGCTHFPIIEKEINTVLPSTKCINMGKILVESIDLPNETKGSINLYFGIVNDSVKFNANATLNFEFELHELI